MSQWSCPRCGGEFVGAAAGAWLPCYGGCGMSRHWMQVIYYKITLGQYEALWNEEGDYQWCRIFRRYRGSPRGPFIYRGKDIPYTVTEGEINMMLVFQ